MATPSEPRPGVQHRWWLAATLALVLALVVLAVAKIDLAKVARSLESANVALVLVAVTLMASSFMARSESWFAVIKAAVPDPPVDRAATRRALLIGIATSTLAPARLGEGARAWVIARRIGDPREVLATVAATVLFQTLVNLLALTILAAIALSSPMITHAHTASLALAIALPGLVVLLLVIVPWALAHVARVARGRLRAGATWMLHQLLAARHGLNAFRHPIAAAHACSTQLLAWGLQLATCYLLMRALHLGTAIGLSAAAAVLVAVNLTAILPVTPSNVGVFQAACIAALAPFGVASSEALAYGLLLQSVEVFCSLSLGIPALLKEGTSWGELRGGMRAGWRTRGEPRHDP